MSSQKVTLVICDGLGLTPEVVGNAFANAQTPTFDYLLKNYPALRLLAAGTEVGLDMGEPGNSEVGHLTIGTGQVIPQAFQTINSAIKSEQFGSNKSLTAALHYLSKNPTKTLHVVGLVSTGGVHGHISHMMATLQLAHKFGVQRVAVHAITDGRDTAQRVAIKETKDLLMTLKKDFPFGVVASVGGRYYALDRDSHWERTDSFYWAMLGKAALPALSFEQAINDGYQRGEGDESIQPTVITDAHGSPVAAMQAGDVVVMTNYRPDRARQLAIRLISLPFPLTMVTMTDYFLGENPPLGSPNSKIVPAFPMPKPKGSLAEAIARAGKSQLHIAETEKYAHVTYFFNGHQEKKHPRESWLLLPSVRVVSFDWVPEMSAASVTAAYMQSKLNNPADFTTVNFANMDMVGHTGNYEAALVAVTAVDQQLKTLVEYAEKQNEWLLITADHGNCEQMINPETRELDKEHTVNPVPLIVVHPKLRQARNMDKFQLAVLSNIGMLADIAPTILAIMDVRQPREMVGGNLLGRL